MNFQIKILLLSLIFISPGASELAQPAQVTGLWLVEKVSAGNQGMTPIAKWTRINPDGTFQSGNGWLQNAEGTWSYNSTEESFLPTRERGIIDPFGAFSVSFDNEKMIWKRDEEGMQVTVTWRPIVQLPKAPADHAQGLWDLANATQKGQSMLEQLDPQNKTYIFLRWDRIYVERTAGGERKTGYWHMNAHSPEITLMSHVPGAEPLSWMVEFTGDGTMIWSGSSKTNSGQKRVYEHLDQFPK